MRLATTKMSRRIVVVSDSHDHLPEKAVRAWKGADEVWHLGDVTALDVLDPIIAAGFFLRVVRGNCDGMDWPPLLDLVRGGVRCRLQHIPPERPLPQGETDLLLHGHTHVPRDENIHGVRYLNPGSVGRANKGAPASFA